MKLKTKDSIIKIYIKKKKKPKSGRKPKKFEQQQQQPKYKLNANRTPIDRMIIMGVTHNNNQQYCMGGYTNLIGNLDAWWLGSKETDALHLTLVVKSDNSDE